MEHPDDEREQEPAESLGEDHRDGPPGYDLDEQEAIEELKRSRERHEAERDAG